MKILLVGGGAGISIKDVENGYYEALVRAGADVKLHLLDYRIDNSYKYLVYAWENFYQGKKTGYPGPTWNDAIYLASQSALEMALKFDVDWVIIVSAMYFHPDMIILMHRAGLHMAVLLTESPYMDLEQGRVVGLDIDGAWTTELASVPVLKKSNSNVQYIRHAYDSTKHFPVLHEGNGEGDAGPDWLNNTIPSHDVVFVGTAFEERIETLEAVDWTGIDLGLYGNWELLDDESPLHDFVRGEYVSNTDVAKLYSKAKVGLNLYRDSELFGLGTTHIKRGAALSMNPRAYELAACKVPTISDWRLEQEETLGDSVMTFKEPVQLEYNIREMLKDKELRLDMAERAFCRIQGHTFDERVKQIFRTLEG